MSGGERGQRGKETSSSKVGGAAASGAGSTMLHFVDVVKQYPGQEQVDLRVEIEVPGTWFGGTSQGCLTNAEKREKYKAQAVEFSELREFVGPSSRKKIRAPAIRFICQTDAQDDPSNDGYWMQLAQWNRYRHDTFKNRPSDELPYIRERVVVVDEGVGAAPAAPTAVKGSPIHDAFTLVKEGTHTQRSGKEVPCRFWRCKQTHCKLHGDTIKEIGKGTGQLFRHLKKCNTKLWREMRLSSAHSKARLDEKGEEIEVNLQPSCLALSQKSQCRTPSPTCVH